MKEIIRYIVPYLGFLTIRIVLGELGIKVGQTGLLILIGLISVYYFILDNPYKPFKKSVIILFIGFLIVLGFSKTYGLGTWLPAILSGALALVYFNRFKSRPDKHWVDYLKVIGVFSIIPALYFDVAVIVFPFLASIFLLDRLIIRPVMNKTTQIIIYCIISLVCITLLLFAYIKANDAEKRAYEARELQMQVIELQDQVDALKTKAEEAVAEALRQSDLAAQAIEDCETK
ncbi:hypothetical protein SAMN05421640_3235 [Ekhidna lutea]|uniref:Uncharacterized protein n=1 Tax=Ekhidna lutea TaxID=447679 RepID=A0A239LFL4_EKHLU|nr:cell envelope integrity protein TolA [Ekhidna lutea]SNT29261.1 hypothetical protein SAMN05421640_3235 [Ekhidna lutea]